MSNFDLEQAITCGHLSNYVYLDNFERHISLMFKANIRTTDFNINGSFVSMFVFKSVGYIVFRGTEPTDWRDLVADIRAWPTESDTTGNVHRGFKRALDFVYPNIINWLSNNIGTSNKIVITGHSLGAAMASICTARINKKGYNVSLYTYGSPRVGNKVWTKQFENIDANRIVNNNDIITKIPPFGLYHHVGKICYMDYKGILHMSTPTTTQRFIDKLRSFLRACAKGQIFSLIYDHFMDHYVEKLKRNR